MGKNISKNLSDKYNQKLLDHAKQAATDTLKKTSKRVIQKTAEATGDFIGNISASRISKRLKNSQTVTNENDKEIPKEIYISQEERQKIINNLILI